MARSSKINAMRMGAGAVDLMTWLTEKYVATSNGNYRVWNFTPAEGDPRIVELIDLGLVKPVGSRGGPHMLTERGHRWVMDNRTVERNMDDEFEEMAFPETFMIRDVEYRGQRAAGKNEILIPCTGEPIFRDGDVIYQKTGRGLTELRIVEGGFSKGGSLETSRHPDMLTLIVENITAAQHRTPRETGGISVGSISAQSVQVGHGNVQNVNITVQDLVQQVAKSGDAEAKSALTKFFGNPTVSGILGGGVVEVLKKILGK